MGEQGFKINSQRVEYYDLLRVILVFLVVAGHGTYYQVTTNFGGIYYNTMMQEIGVEYSLFYKVIYLFKSFIYTFHMPTFIALSGSIFQYNKETNFCHFVVKKAKRLIVPFITVWLCWNLPIKYLTGYYKGVCLYKILLQMVFPANVYLWFLESLFVIFILAFFLIKIDRKKVQIIIVLFAWLVGLFIYMKYDEWHFLGDPLYYLGWFYLGYRVEDVISLLKKYNMWNLVSTSFAFFFVIGIFLLNYKYSIFYITQACQYLVFPTLMFIVLNYIVRKIKVKGNWIGVASEYSLGIYLYAEPLNYLILFMYWKFCGIEYFGSEIGSILIFFSRILITPIVAIIIVLLLKKCRLKYLY